MLNYNVHIYLYIYTVFNTSFHLSLCLFSVMLTSYSLGYLCCDTHTHTLSFQVLKF